MHKSFLQIFCILKIQNLAFFLLALNGNGIGDTICIYFSTTENHQCNQGVKEVSVENPTFTFFFMTNVLKCIVPSFQLPNDESSSSINQSMIRGNLKTKVLDTFYQTINAWFIHSRFLTFTIIIFIFKLYIHLIIQVRNISSYKSFFYVH